MSTEPLFSDHNVDDNDLPETTEIESLCMECGDNGITKLLLTRIPFYKDVVLMSFHCEHCGNHNNELQPGGKIQEKGIVIQLRVRTEEDLNRQVVKSDYAVVKIPELEFEVPAQSQSGEITTIEGIVNRAIRGLKRDQPLRRTLDETAAVKIDAFVEKLKNLKLMTSPFTIIVQDISGNSYIENLKAPYSDPELVTTDFQRTAEQNKLLGIYNEEEEKNPELDMKDEVLSFSTNCPSCNVVCETNMKVVDIPHFKEVVIMSTLCDACGRRTNEVKSGGGIEKQGCKISLHVQNKDDLNRDILKSETCYVQIPELDFEVGGAAQGGRFTTVEGLLTSIKSQLVDANPLLMGDSASTNVQEKLKKFMTNFDDIISGKTSVHLILDDSAGNSYIEDLYTPALDPRLCVEKYERTFQQNEDLGLNDMKVENYGET